ncbi:small ubiquitin-related modifier 3-like isoform X1 [Penaeus japonicus]|uniref:small ubiquitin-related modifier 3-like isoform X1 n=1 Tax=Penaeus japonicus TaxID=27405 RepID=UPI001C70CF2E|nr:small ubiquitin-related modifier 3-like isoform X1 [Penaeus japonicus]
MRVFLFFLISEKKRERRNPLEDKYQTQFKSQNNHRQIFRYKNTKHGGKKREGRDSGRVYKRSTRKALCPRPPICTMSEEAKKEEKPSEHINLKVVGQDGQVVHFKIKKHTSLKKLINAYCERSKLVQTTVRFRFDGQPITENDTPQGLEMEDGDTIEVFQQQTGGSFPSHLVLL